jgi:hypothetical protein
VPPAPKVASGSASWRGGPDFQMREIRVGCIAAVLGQAQVVESFDAVVVVLFSADKLVLVRNEQRPWDLPGMKRLLPAGPRPACRDGESRTRPEQLLTGPAAACMKTCPADTTRSPRLEGVSCRAWSCMGRHRDGGWELYVQRRDWSAFQHRLFQAGAAHATPSQWLEYILSLRLTLGRSYNTICARSQVGRTIESALTVNVQSSPCPPAVQAAPRGPRLSPVKALSRTKQEL